MLSVQTLLLTDQEYLVNHSLLQQTDYTHSYKLISMIYIFISIGEDLS